jgi:putative phosphoesterase
MKKKKMKILAAGDIHGKPEIAEHLAERAEKEKVDLVILAGDLHGNKKTSPGIIEPFKRRNKNVVFVPGNWDTSAEASLLKEMYKIQNLDGYYASYGDIDIVGVGNPDFKIDIDNRNSLEKIIKNFEKIKNKKTKKILVSHIHAHGTIAEFSGFEGSKVIRKAIEYFQPDIAISAHIHEAEGTEERIGKTRVLNVGKHGKIFEI